MDGTIIKSELTSDQEKSSEISGIINGSITDSERHRMITRCESTPDNRREWIEWARSERQRMDDIAIKNKNLEPSRQEPESMVITPTINALMESILYQVNNSSKVGVALLEGPPGTGKSQIIQKVLVSITEQAHIISASGFTNPNQLLGATVQKEISDSFDKDMRELFAPDSSKSGTEALTLIEKSISEYGISIEKFLAEYMGMKPDMIRILLGQFELAKAFESRIYNERFDSLEYKGHQYKFPRNDQTSESPQDSQHFEDAWHSMNNFKLEAGKKLVNLGLGKNFASQFLKSNPAVDQIEGEVIHYLSRGIPVGIDEIDAMSSQARDTLLQLLTSSRKNGNVQIGNTTFPLEETSIMLFTSNNRPPGLDAQFRSRIAEILHLPYPDSHELALMALALTMGEDGKSKLDHASQQNLITLFHTLIPKINNLYNQYCADVKKNPNAPKVNPISLRSISKLLDKLQQTDSPTGNSNNSIRRFMEDLIKGNEILPNSDIESDTAKEKLLQYLNNILPQGPKLETSQSNEGIDPLLGFIAEVNFASNFQLLHTLEPINPSDIVIQSPFASNPRQMIKGGLRAHSTPNGTTVKFDQLTSKSLVETESNGIILGLISPDDLNVQPGVVLIQTQKKGVSVQFFGIDILGKPLNYEFYLDQKEITKVETSNGLVFAQSKTDAGMSGVDVYKPRYENNKITFARSYLEGYTVSVLDGVIVLKKEDGTTYLLSEDEMKNIFDNGESGLPEPEKGTFVPNDNFNKRVITMNNGGVKQSYIAR